MHEKVVRHRELWKKKKILREIYTEWYTRIIADLKPGPGKTVELGAGSGNFKAFKPDVIAADIEKCEWLDMCFDAHHMPFGDSSVSNVVMIDVLHHLSDPIGFLHEAWRVLEPQGRIVLLEPFPSLFSLFVYRLVHPEPFLMQVDYFQQKARVDKDPWDANQAIAYLLFFKFRKKFRVVFQNRLDLVKTQKMSFVLYPASGGFENKALIPEWLIPVFKIVEKLATPFGFLLAFRCYVVIEKK